MLSYPLAHHCDGIVPGHLRFADAREVPAGEVAEDHRGADVDPSGGVVPPKTDAWSEPTAYSPSTVPPVTPTTLAHGSVVRQ